MNTLYESILADIEDTLTNGDKTAKKLHSAGSKLEIHEIFGVDNVLLSLSLSKLYAATKDMEYITDKSVIDEVIDYYESRNSGLYTLSKTVIKLAQLLILYIENMPLTDTNIDFDNKKVKDEFCKDLTDNLKSKGIMSNMEFNNSAGDGFGGDKKGMFMLTLRDKRYDMLTFLFKIKK